MKSRIITGSKKGIPSIIGLGNFKLSTICQRLRAQKIGVYG